MALHPKLQPYQGRKYIKRLSPLLGALEKDLASLQCSGLSVELIEEEDTRSFADKFLAFREEVHFERVMAIELRVRDCEVRVLVPMHGIELWPYTVEIPLRVPVCTWAAYEQGFVKKHWVTEPKDDSLEKGLAALKLPGIRWKHKDRMSKFKVGRAFELIPGDDDEPATWTIHSGYFAASFFGGKLPKVSSFFEAVPALERFLSTQAR